MNFFKIFYYAILFLYLAFLNQNWTDEEGINCQIPKYMVIKEDLIELLKIKII